MFLFYLTLIHFSYVFDSSLGHFVTNVCAIVGGIFTVAGIFDSILNNSLHVIRKKIELGKFS